MLVVSAAFAADSTGKVIVLIEGNKPFSVRGHVWGESFNQVKAKEKGTPLVSERESTKVLLYLGDERLFNEDVRLEFTFFQDRLFGVQYTFEKTKPCDELEGFLKNLESSLRQRYGMPTKDEKVSPCKQRTEWRIDETQVNFAEPDLQNRSCLQSSTDTRPRWISCAKRIKSWVNLSYDYDCLS
jgi:hypothetical protein